MPNRIIKAGIHTSEKVNAMTDFQFRVWVSLITYVDDYGRGDGRPPVIRGACFPLREDVTNETVDEALRALEALGSIRLYEVDGRRYLCLPSWEEHQRIRNKRELYPAPPPEGEAPSTDDNAPQPAAARCQTTADGGLNPIQSESISESESKSKSKSEPLKPKAKTDVFAALAGGDEILLNTLREYEKMRDRIRKPMTDKARSMLEENLKDYPREQWVPILEQSIFNSWQRIYPLQQKGTERRTDNGYREDSLRRITEKYPDIHYDVG